MIKALVAGIWTILLLTGSLYYFVGEGNKSEANSTKDGEYKGSLEVVKLDPMSVTIIRDNTLQGYVILDISFTIQKSKMGKHPVPVELVLRDAVNNSIFRNDQIDINRLDRFDFKEFKDGMMREIAAKFGKDFINDVLIERIDFLSGDSIRDKKLRGG